MQRARAMAVILLVGLMGAAPPARPTASRTRMRGEGDRLWARMEEARRAGRLDEAISWARQALALDRQRNPLQARLADRLGVLADLCESKGDWTGAGAARREALAIRTRLFG